jgi:hypothetical protein
LRRVRLQENWVLGGRVLVFRSEGLPKTFDLIPAY